MVSTISRFTMTEQVFEQLRDAILSGELEPGSLHSVNELAKNYGISRTPVREATLRLADVNLLSIERNRGFRIRESDVDDIRNIFQIRLLLEVPAAGVAAATCDAGFSDGLDRIIADMVVAGNSGNEQEFDEYHRLFHEFIVAVLKNERLNSIVSSLRVTKRSRSSVVPRHRALLNIAEAHSAIARGISSRNRYLAEEAMRIHLVDSGRLVLDQVASRTNAEIPANWFPET